MYATGHKTLQLMLYLAKSIETALLNAVTPALIEAERTMLGGGSGGGIQNDTTQQSNIEDSSQVSNDMDDEIPF